MQPGTLRRIIPPIAAIAVAFACATVRVQAQAKPDPVIEAARQAAALYAQSLPDYIVKRTTTRYHSAPRPMSADASTSTFSPRLGPSPPAAPVSGWQTLDTITGNVAVERGREVYTNIRVNGNPAKYLPPGGSWSAGEFAAVMLSVLAPERAAVFTHQHSETIRNHPSWRYDFAVDKAHSAWDMAAVNTGYTVSNLSYFPAYGGKIWIDKGTGQMISVDISTHGLPSGFPVATVESRTDFDFVTIGAAKYLLPVHSETVSCQPGGTVCLRNETDFSNYDKFVSNSDISFGDLPK